MNIDTYIVGKLFSVARMLGKAGDIIFSRFGITSRSYDILMHISNGVNTTAKLAHAMQSSLANITHKTKLLEERGYIKRKVDPNDKRVWFFSITEEGKKLLETANLLSEKAIEELYSQFSSKQKQQILDFLKTTEKNLDNALQDRKEFAEFLEKLLATEKGGKSWKIGRASRS